MLKCLRRCCRHVRKISRYLQKLPKMTILLQGDGKEERLWKLKTGVNIQRDKTMFEDTFHSEFDGLSLMLL